MELKNKDILNLNNFVYAVVYSNYFKIVSTVTILVSWTGLIWGIHCTAVSLHNVYEALGF